MRAVDVLRIFLTPPISTMLCGLFLLLATAYAAPSAPVLNDSPTHLKYTADFDLENGVNGYVSFTSLNGTVVVHVDLYNFPDSGGPFMYHVHEAPVPPDGNCYGTLGHLNPYNGSVDAPTADTKEVGDLSGKHGLLLFQRHLHTYIEPYLSLNPSNLAFDGGLSVVIHLANNDRIACANITERLANSLLGANRLLPHKALPMVAGAAAVLL